MINQYDKPAQFNPDYLKYNPYPNDFLLRAGETLQKRADDVDQESYKLQDLLAKVHAIDEHKDFKKAIDEKYYTKLSSIADQVSKGDINGAQKELKKTSYDFYSDPIRNELETSYSQKADYLKKKIELADKYAPWEDPTLGFQGKDAQGNIQGFRFNGLGEVQDHQKRAEDMMNNLKASGYETSGFNLDPNTGDILSIKKGQEGIASNWVRGIAQQKAMDFLNTKEGTGWIKEQAYKHNIPLQNISQKDAMILASDYLYNAGMNQIFAKTTNGNSLNLGPEGWGRGVDSKGRIETNPFENVNENNNLLKALKGASMPTAESMPGVIGGSSLGLPNTQIKPPVKKYDFSGLSKDEKKSFEYLKGIFKGKDDEETYTNISKYLDDIHKQRVPVPYIAYEPKVSDKETKFIQDNILGRMFLDPSTGETWDGHDFLNKVLKGDKEKLRVIGENSTDNFYTDITGNPRFSQAQNATVGDKGYVIGMSKGEFESREGQTKLILNRISAARRTGVPIPLDPDGTEVGNPTVHYNPKTQEFHITFEGKNTGHTDLKGQDPTELLNLYLQETKKK